MRIAFLVIAHTDEKQLKKLVDRLSPNKYFDSAVFLHIDAKSDINLFDDAISCEHVYLTKKRVNVVRCGISQVEAELELMRAALERGEKFDRYILITGQDYPVVSNKRIYQEMLKNKEFMRGYKVTGNKMNVKVRKFYFYNRFLTGSTFKNLIRRFLQLFFRPFTKHDTIQISGNKWDIYYSSAYFAVGSELFKELYEKGTNKKYFNYFKTAICSDEMYFITIAANGKYRDKLEIIDNPSHVLVDNSSITFFEYKDRPSVLTESDFEKIKNSKRIFARKFSSKESYELINKLILENETDSFED